LHYVVTLNVTMPKEIEIDYKLPIGVSLPQSMIKEIDEKKGRLCRSTYILLLLEKALKVA